jgi:type I restriction-modification system DNA methylase subunit
MALFQKSVLLQYLKQLDKSKVEVAFQTFKAHFHNATIQQHIRDSKEEQYQGEFLIDLFVNVLGYTKNPQPNFNLQTEQKNETNSKKADGAILKDGNAIAVIELKGTNTTDLATVAPQAFGYKNNQKECKYVIISNFEKLRFYIDNAIDFEEFNLFTLTENEFTLLYLCLHIDSIFSDLPAIIKQKSAVKEQDITKQLYKDYSDFKRKLFADIVQLNPIYDKLILFKKSQKLLDRILFVLFAEDRNLIPANTIHTILSEFENLKKLDAYQPLYERFKKHFTYLNVGFKNDTYEVYGYNGGLFANDEILDNIKISDNLLQNYVPVLSKYDYETDVDVNILGHIFEHSLNDIEEIQAEIDAESNGFKPIEKKTSKRKKDGVFYTPKYITKYIVENTVGALCIEKRNEFEINADNYTPDKRKAKKKELLQKLDAYQSWLLQITIVDPACGSGAFLNQALDFLIQEHKNIDELRAQLLGESMVLPDHEVAILENNIFGVDLNEESVEIARLSLWLRTAQKGRKLNSLNNNIKCGNSLIDDRVIAGDNAFNWQNEFPKIFENGGFDVVIGNPPYVFARENFLQSEKDYFVEKFISAKYQINTYLLFIEKTIHLLKNKGHYGLIIPNSWLMVYSGESLRKFILDNCKVKEIINLEGYSFESVNVETVILLAEKENNYKTDDSIKIKLNNGNEFYLSHVKNQNSFYNNEGFEFRVFSNNDTDSILSRLNHNTLQLDALVDVKAGLQAYEKDKGEPKQTIEDVVNRPYDYNYKFDANTHKYLDGKDVKRYATNWSGLYLKYGNNLAAPRTFNLFDGKKIIVREITGSFPKCLISTYSEELFLYNRSNIGIIEKPNLDISLKYILSLLNSTLLSYYFMKNTAKSVRKLFPKIILNDLKKFPIKQIPVSEQQPFIEKAETMLQKNKELQTIKSNVVKLLQSQYSGININNKLSNWNELSFKDFCKELEKQKIKLTISEKAELMQYFETEQTKANTIQQTITQTDKEIDTMVYKLYELSDEEIKIVESN